MNKPAKKILIIIGVLILLVCLIGGIFFISQKTKSEPNEEPLYSTTYGFAFGSRRTRIYLNGEVYDDLEIENPNHIENYAYLKTLSSKELNDFKNFLTNETDSEKIDDYVIELVYGVEKFDDMGNY